MQSTLSIFEDRKAEIELYYSIMLDIDSGTSALSYDKRFLKIIKSNFILMLYNIIEACIVSGMMEIYESLENDNCTYDQVIEEIQNIWCNFQISQIYGPTTGQKAYVNRVKEVIDNIIQKHPIILKKEALKVSGNLDARIIKRICDNHRIRYVAKDSADALQTIKLKRNSLAHGDVSFSDCARDFTISDLEEIKDATIKFMESILNGMQKYYIEKGYLIESHA